MAETIVEKATCENCGADVRENTQFCYNCGKSFVEPAANGSAPATVADKARAALEDLAAKLKMDEADNADRLALAAAERKKARVAAKQPKEVVWEEAEGRSGWAFLIISLVIFVVTATVVFFTVYWK